MGAVERARAMLGVRFRLHGRDAAGLDCVGLAAAALAFRGVPGGYALRGGDPEKVTAWLDARLARGRRWRAGDLLLLASGPGQLHCAIWTGDAIIHADAGLGRVVERPGMPPWPVIGAWRVRDEEGGGTDGDIGADGTGHSGGRADRRGDRGRAGQSGRPAGVGQPA